MNDAPARAGALAALLWVLFTLRWSTWALPGARQGSRRCRPGCCWRPCWPRSASGCAAAGPRYGASRSGRWRGGWPGHGTRLLLPAPDRLERRRPAVTADGALSGIVALHVLNGSEHLVFVPQVPYSGSLKSHVAALVATVIEPARAFALASVLFYPAFAAGLYRRPGSRPVGPRAALPAGLYAAFARVRDPLQPEQRRQLRRGAGARHLGAWLARAGRTSRRGAPLALAGLLLGLAFWCHILAVIHLAALGLFLSSVAPRSAWRPLLGPSRRASRSATRRAGSGTSPTTGTRSTIWCPARRAASAPAKRARPRSRFAEKPG